MSAGATALVAGCTSEADDEKPGPICTDDTEATRLSVGAGDERTFEIDSGPCALRLRVTSITGDPVVTIENGGVESGPFRGDTVADITADGVDPVTVTIGNTYSFKTVEVMVELHYRPPGAENLER